MRVFAGDYRILEQADVVILCCGAGQRPGETRLQLPERSAAVFVRLVLRVRRYAKDQSDLAGGIPIHCYIKGEHQ